MHTLEKNQYNVFRRIYAPTEKTAPLSAESTGAFAVHVSPHPFPSLVDVRNLAEANPGEEFLAVFGEGVAGVAGVGRFYPRVLVVQYLPARSYAMSVIEIERPVGSPTLDPLVVFDGEIDAVLDGERALRGLLFTDEALASVGDAAVAFFEFKPSSGAHDPLSHLDPSARHARIGVDGLSRRTLPQDAAGVLLPVYPGVDVYPDVELPSEESSPTEPAPPAEEDPSP